MRRTSLSALSMKQPCPSCNKDQRLELELVNLISWYGPLYLFIQVILSLPKMGNTLIHEIVPLPFEMFGSITAYLVDGNWWEGI
jgi:hypothetical protein